MLLTQINSADIQSVAAEVGAIHAELLATNGRPVGEDGIRIYRLIDPAGTFTQLVCETNGDPIWQEDAPEAFALAAAECDPDDITYQLYESLQDARSWLRGTQDWEWGGEASWEGWCQFAYEHGCRDADDDALLARYLRSVGEEPADYGSR